MKVNLRSVFWAGALAWAGSASGAAALGCDALSLQAVAPADTIVASAEMVKTPIPNCKVEGWVTTTNPGPNRVHFRVQLPEKSLWNGRYYFMGLGGSAGSMPPAPPKILGSGFVVAVTDTGHQGHLLDWSFMSHQVQALDPIHRGGHVATVAGQTIAKAYYGVDKLWRYHLGCSGGGRMGTMAIRHHPEDYDGVMVGGNGNLPKGGVAGAEMLKFTQTTQEQYRPGGWVSPAKLLMVEGHVTAACDMTDGAKDGVVWDSRLCRYDVAKLLCKATDGPDCLTKSEIRTIKAIVRGPYDTKGRKLSEGMPISNMSMWQFNGRVAPPWKPEASFENLATASSAYVIPTTMAHGMIRKDYDVLKDMDFSEAALQEWDKGFRDSGFAVPANAEHLLGFEKAGGKLIKWSGSSDPCCSYIEQENTYDNAVGGLGAERVAKMFALYSIPGMGHCAGGTGPEDAIDMMLVALIDWVEKGKAPGAIAAHRGDRVQTPFKVMATTAEAGVPLQPSTGQSRDFLLCRYPMVSVFDRSKANVPGAVLDAANWSCRAKR